MIVHRCCSELVNLSVGLVGAFGFLAAARRHPTGHSEETRYDNG